MSATIIPFLDGHSFDRENLRTYDTACVTTPQPGQATVVREVIARRIVEIAKTGERDPQRLGTRSAAFASAAGLGARFIGGLVISF